MEARANEKDLLRQIPAVDLVLLRPGIQSWIKKTSHSFVVSELQSVLQQIRSSILSASSPPDFDLSVEYIEATLERKLQGALTPTLRPVINATGVILHTNLGRAPLSTSAQETLSALSSQYTNLEYDLGSGARSSHRDLALEQMLRRILHCDAATVVNNNAAAVFLIANTLASGREVIVSRGELVEIGGSFRIPDILERSGAILREVGTTNRTRIGDYRAAINPATALILRVHPSNYRIRGFTERPALSELAALSRDSQVSLVEDVGSGCLLDLTAYGIDDEPVVQGSLQAGAQLVCFSGDKLLGGPQAGILAGSQELIERIRKNPLMRAFRLDKLILGALEATLTSYCTERAAEEIPVLRMLAMTRDEIEKRARGLIRKLRTAVTEIEVNRISGYSVIGGGSCPDSQIETILVSLESSRCRPSLIESRLRSQNPPVIARVEEDRVLLDLRTVFPAQEPDLLIALANVLR